MPLSEAAQKAPVVFETPYFGLRELPHKPNQPYYVLDRPDSVTLVPVSRDGKTLLLQLFRPPIGGNSWEFPIGSMEAGEQPVEAAQRELAEETKITDAVLTEIGWFNPIAGLAPQRNFVFVALVDSLDGVHGVVGEDDILGSQTVTFDRLEAMVAAGEIRDGFTMLSWAIARPQVMKILEESN